MYIDIAYMCIHMTYSNSVYLLDVEEEVMYTETYLWAIRDLDRRHIKRYTWGWKRSVKETYKRDLQKRPGQEPNKETNQKVKRDVLKKAKMKRRPDCIRQKRDTKETYKRDIQRN